MSASENFKAEDRLDSWKEIASYMNRQVRTVQRWEKSEGLPVKRHEHAKLASVYAFKHELDAWRIDRRSVADQADLDLESGDDRVEPGPDRGDDGGDLTNVADSIPGPQVTVEPVKPIRMVPLRRIGAIAIFLVGLAAFAWVVKHHKPIPAHQTGKTLLVVLPFRSLSDEPAQIQFCKGLTQAMTTQMGRLDPDHFVVIAPTTAERIKDKPIDQIGRELGVQYVLDGTAERAGNQVRIDAQLIQTSDQTLRRAISFSRNLDDVLSLQAEVAQAVAEDIKLTLSPAEQARLEGTKTVDPDAYSAYLNGLVDWNSRAPQGVVKSIDYFKESIAKNPNFALAYAGLADAYSIASAVPTAAMDPRSVMPSAKDAAEHALRIDPESAEAHAALGLVLQSYDWNLPAAEEQYKQAFAINPSYGSARHWHSLLLMAEGRQAEAQAEVEYARTLDPLSPVIQASQIQAYYFARKYDLVIEQSHMAIEKEPNFLIIRYHLGQALAATGRYDEAIAQFQEGSAKSGGAPVFLMAMGHAYALSGKRAEALKCLADLGAMAKKTYIPSLYFAGIYTGLGDRVDAMKWLEKAYDERTEYLIFLNVEPMSDPLRSDPAFQSLISRIKPS